ncbi:Calmodulin-interacting protein 111-like protein [Drosera capensis]
MPSKSKKQPKTPSRAPKPSPSPSPSTPSYSSQFVTANAEGSTEGELRSYVWEAASKFPLFIGEEAIVGRVVEGEAREENGRGCRVWLSETAMVSGSISPGAVVSVALAPSSRRHGDAPLSLIAAEFSASFGVELGARMVDRAGNYFVMATVFPSCKVSRSDVRLSSSLSYSLGSPACGSFAFIHPICDSPSIAKLGQENGQQHNLDLNAVQPQNCDELHLELVASVKASMRNGGGGVPSKGYSGVSRDEVESVETASPRTPASYNSRLHSPSSITLSSVANKDSGLMDTNDKDLDTSEIRELLRDNFSKNLLQTCAASWLYSRHLLLGNLVIVPMLSSLVVFRVFGAKRCFQTTGNGDKTGMVCDIDDAFTVDHDTKVHMYLPSEYESVVSRQRSSLQNRTPSGVEDDLPQLGGLSKEYGILKDILSFSVKNPLASLGLRPIKGVLLHGPTGTGKTSLALRCAHDCGMNLFRVNGAEIVSQYYGESEQALHEVFKSASESAPSVVFIDELDSIAPARKDGGDGLSPRMVATLLELMDGVIRMDGVLVMAATNRIEAIEPALRRPGRFDREIEIGVPSPDQRLDILHTLLGRMEHSLSDQEIQQLGTVTHGFVGADLASLCTEAAILCLRRYIELESCDDASSHCDGSSEVMVESSNRDLGYGEAVEAADCMALINSTRLLSLKDEPLDCTNIIQSSSVKNEAFVGADEDDSSLTVTFDDFDKARMKVRPSAMREVILEIPKVRWEDIGGQHEVKAQLREVVEWPQKHPDAFKRIGISPPTGVLLYGPPGCSKTLMARAVASEAGLNFLAVKGPQLYSKWVGESEKAVKSLFAKARANAPSIIFLDELDSIAPIRGREKDGVSVTDRVVSQLLVEMDGKCPQFVSKSSVSQTNAWFDVGLHERVNVTVIAATNCEDQIDPALLRPGRFGRLLKVKPPNEVDREEIFRIHLRKIPCNSNVDISELARLTEGCTGADISLTCRQAGILAIEEFGDAASEIKMEHLKGAIQLLEPSSKSDHAKGETEPC